MGEAWKEPPPGLWQWEHRTGFKDYDEETIQRIEAAYLRGDPFVRFKAGKTRSTPMELFFVDMIQHDPITHNQRNIRRTRKDYWYEFLRRKSGELIHSLETGRKYRLDYQHYIKARREKLNELDTHEYSEMTLYKDSGCCAAIARHPAFGFLIMLAVISNSLWLGVDANFNSAATIWQADAGFQFVEHTFSVLFVVELAIRFGALKQKRYLFSDGWLLFDLVLVSIMVGENMVMLPLYLMHGNDTNAAAFGDVSIFRLCRLLRLTRLTRVARLLRVAPEVLTMLRGITTALRTVITTGLLLVILLYLFGIVFKIQSKAYPEITIFETVGDSMWILLLQGSFLDAVADVVFGMKDVSWILTFIFMVFIFLSNWCILNMLVGILCEVATNVDKKEKEQAAISYLKHHLLEILEVHDKNDDRHINKDDFELLMRNPEMHMILKNFGVDTEDLLSLQGILFETKTMIVPNVTSGTLDEALTPSNAHDAGNDGVVAAATSRKHTRLLPEEKRLRFAEFLEVVLRLRGGNFAAVRDIVDLREYVRQRMDQLEMQLPKPVRPFSKEGPLRAVAAGFDSPSSPSFMMDDAAPKQDGLVAKLLQDVREVRDEMQTMRGQIRRLEEARRAPSEVGEAHIRLSTSSGKHDCGD